uniref:Ycf34 protein n=1 Tax=Laminaria solidungula TaxID=309363 RepID=A0A5B9RQN2_9PHAE|nr:Ycf34 protein [Laminaria solidungula]QEG58267.1 Ycf34 protein [Laminaria solidungula]
MCICLNCNRIDNCEVYFTVEQKHNEKKKYKKKTDHSFPNLLLYYV